MGAALWTDFLLYGVDHYPEAVKAAQTRINDYRRVRLQRDGGRGLMPSDTEEWHREDAAWLDTCLGRPFPGKTVVITHMAPSARSISAPYVGAPLSAAFASNLDHLVERSDLWIHGHMHSSADYRIGRARVVCNPLGYPRREGVPENLSFDPNRVVVL